MTRPLSPHRTTPFVSRAFVPAVAASVLAFSVGACSSDGLNAEQERGGRELDSAVTDAEGLQATSDDLAKDDEGRVGSGCDDFAASDGGKELLEATESPLLDVLAELRVAAPFSRLALGGLSREVDLTDQISEADGATLFLPAPQAMDQLSDVAADRLKASPDLLRDIVGYHVVAGTVGVEDLAAEPLTTLSGDKIAAVVDEDGRLMVDTAGLVCGPFPVADGAVYVIDAINLPVGG